MSESLPGRQSATGTPVLPPPPRQRDPGPIARKVFEATTPLSMRLMPRIPDAVKRVLLGGRGVTVDGNTLDTTLQLALNAERLTGVGRLVAREDPDFARVKLDGIAGALRSDLPVDVTDGTIPGPGGPMRSRHYRPVTDGSETAPPPALVYYHGGGFVIGGLVSHDNLCRLICHEGAMQVIAVDYRLAPEHPAPAAADDAYAIYRWALENAADLGADPARVAVGGDSAGGNLAAVVSQRARDEGVPLPALQLLLYPMTNATADTRSKTLFADGFFLTARNMDWFRHLNIDRGVLERSDPRVSPLLADSLAGLPPALVYIAGFDPLRDEGIQYAEAMRDAGVDVDLRVEGSLIHAFANFFPLGGRSATATSEMVAALREHLR